MGLTRRELAGILAALPVTAVGLWLLPMVGLLVVGTALASLLLGLAAAHLLGQRPPYVPAPPAPPPPAVPPAPRPSTAFLAHPAGVDRKRAVLDTVESLLASEDLDDELRALLAVEADRVPAASTAPDPPAEVDPLAALDDALNDGELEP